MDKVEQDFATVESNASDKARERGNVAFAKGDYDNALAAYTEAIEANIWDPKAWGNRSLTYLRLERWGETELDATMALTVRILKQTETNKACYYYRRGTARFYMGKLNKAEMDLLRSRDLLLSPQLQPSKELVVGRLAQVRQAQLDNLSGRPAPPLTMRRVRIDHVGFPHTIETILVNASPELLVAFRNTNRHFRNHVSKLTDHNEISCFDSADRESQPQQDDFIEWRQPAPHGRVFRFAKRDILPLTPQAHKAMLALTTKTRHRLIDIRGTIPNKVLSSIDIDTDVLRIRGDKDGNYPDEHLNLSRFGINKVVVFPLTGAQAMCQLAKTERDANPSCLVLPRTVKRFVYPLLVREDEFGGFGQWFMPFVPKFPSATSRPIDSLQSVQQEVVILCPRGKLPATPMNALFNQEDHLRLLILTCMDAHTIKIVNYTTDSKAQNRLKTKVKGVLEEAAVNEMALPPHKRWPHGVPEPGLVDIKVKFSTETEYRATLKPGEWEDETVEVMPGFV